uniref:EF-hand domain-containing protein n=1 Tax=Lates calcarifer TaxID=8187 RepID=A0A4W6G1S1_LATCA
MDLDSIEGLNEIRPSVYRAAMKLQSLQRLCHMDVVSVRHVTAAVRSVGGALRLNRQEVTQTLNRMFKGVSQEVPGHMTAEAPEETCDLMFRLYDRSESRSRFSVCLESVHKPQRGGKVLRDGCTGCDEFKLFRLNFIYSFY